jgi:hypothetical protein
MRRAMSKKAFDKIAKGMSEALRVARGKGKLAERPATYTCDSETADIFGHLYYFALGDRAPPPYRTRRHVQAILVIADDGTLAGVELIDNTPPPPKT